MQSELSYSVSENFNASGIMTNSNVAGMSMNAMTMGNPNIMANPEVP